MLSLDTQSHAWMHQFSENRRHMNHVQISVHHHDMRRLWVRIKWPVQWPCLILFSVVGVSHGRAGLWLILPKMPPHGELFERWEESCCGVENGRIAGYLGDFTGINTGEVTAMHLIKSDCYIWQAWPFLSHSESLRWKCMKWQASVSPPLPPFNCPSGSSRLGQK